jgi:hypothetical protein
VHLLNQPNLVAGTAAALLQTASVQWLIAVVAEGCLSCNATPNTKPVQHARFAKD